MDLKDIFTDFQNEMTQCDNLIEHAHMLDSAGNSILPLIDRKQITVAAFLNVFIAWETFLESAFAAYLTGKPTMTGRVPTCYASPLSISEAKNMIIGVQRYFDYGNHENIIKVAKIYFKDGYPFEPHISSLYSELSDLRTMRNASAHITSTTQKAIESLAVRILGNPQPGIELYQLLTRVDPSRYGGLAVISSYRDKLLTGAQLIAEG